MATKTKMATKKNGKGKRKPLTNRTVTYEPAGPTGNAFWILGVTSRALRESGHADKVKEYNKLATSGNYKHLLAVTRRYVKLVRV